MKQYFKSAMLRLFFAFSARGQTECTEQCTVCGVTCFAVREAYAGGNINRDNRIYRTDMTF